MKEVNEGSVVFKKTERPTETTKEEKRDWRITTSWCPESGTRRREKRNVTPGVTPSIHLGDRARIGFLSERQVDAPDTSLPSELGSQGRPGQSPVSRRRVPSGIDH